MMGDDGEKFGAWPTTWQHCWGEGRWVDRFFEALEANADWLTTTTPSAWLAEHRPIGRVYIPTGSYAEMGEWALPADESRVFASVLHARRHEHRPEARWLRGAFWRNFQVKYREINDLHKQMLRTSDKVDAMAPGRSATSPLDHLYRGQSQRLLLARAVRRDLHQPHAPGHLRAPDRRRGPGRHRGRHARRRRSAATSTWTARTTSAWPTRPGRHGRPDEGAGIGGWDIRPVRHALAAVLRRRPEAYHETLREHEATARGRAPACRSAPRPTAARRPRSTTSSRSRSRARRPAPLRPVRATLRAGPVPRARHHGRRLGDRPGRRSSATRSMAPSRSRCWNPVASSSRARRRPSPARPIRPCRQGPPLGGDRRVPDAGSRRSLGTSRRPPLEARLGLEWTLTMLGGGGNPAAWWEIDGRADRRTTPAGRRRSQRASPRATTTSGSRSRRPSRAGRRLVGARRDHLELRGRLRTRLPGQRACSCRGRSPRAGRRGRARSGHAVRDRARDRSDRSAVR